MTHIDDRLVIFVRNASQLGTERELGLSISEYFGACSDFREAGLLFHLPQHARGTIERERLISPKDFFAL